MIAKTRDALNDRLTNFMSETRPNVSFYVWAGTSIMSESDLSRYS